MDKTLIIAEAGVNHNGSLAIAKSMVETAAWAGADFVKFQTFKAEKMISRQATKASYQVVNTNNATESQLEMVKKLELDLAAHNELLQHSQKHNIGFLSTAFDLESMDLLLDLSIPIFKIPSGEITNLPYLQKIGSLQKPLILSTGMANLAEVAQAVNILLQAGTQRHQLTILHCNTEYPTPMQDVNLNAMLTMQQAFKTQVGYSDHTLGIEVPIAAVAMGAVCIEKHFTLSRSMEGPDHAASLEPKELKTMITAIRNIEKALGNGIKQASPSEIKNKPIARKSIHLSHQLAANHLITHSDLIMKRPGTGISPMLLNLVIGKRTKIPLAADTLLQFNHLNH